MGDAVTAAGHEAAVRIGPLAVWPPVVLAPMAGVTNAPFRRVCRGYGVAGVRAAAGAPAPAPADAVDPGDRPGTGAVGTPPTDPPPAPAAAPETGARGTPTVPAGRPDALGGLFVSEMITARGLVERNDKTLRMARCADDEPVRSTQLYGTDPAVIGEAVRVLVAELGADHVDLNFGCPVAKVTRKGGGAALPVRRRLFADVVGAAVAAAGGVPVTVKMRIGVDDRLHTFLDAGRAAEDAGAAAVALHARTAAQHYSGHADWSAIAALVDAVRTVPVLGNGDVWEAADARRMMAETGCAGVVVGRGCLGRPWLFRDLALAAAGRPVPPAPPLGEVRAVLRRHAHLLATWLTEPVAVRDVRKHVGWYLHGYPVGGEARRDLTTAPTLAAFDAALDRLDPALLPAPGAAAQPRGKTSGPVRVVLPAGWVARTDDPAPAPIDELVPVSGG